MNKIKLIILLLASLTMGAFGSDDEDMPTSYTVETVSQVPTWQVDFSGNDSRPDWQSPNPASFVNWAIVLVKMEDDLIHYVTSDDLMAIFVGDECRGNITLDERLLGSEVCMTVFGRQTGETYTLKYYSHATQSIYTVII